MPGPVLADVASVEQSPPAEAPDEVTAMRLARRYGVLIEVLSECTAVSATYAQPDGTMRGRR